MTTEPRTVPIPHAGADGRAPGDGHPLLPAALLWHAAADGAAHLDLLLADRLPSGPDDPCCRTWRIHPDPGTAACAGPPPAAADFRRRAAVLPAEAIHDHRARYLSLDGPIELDRGRGRVWPVARGTWHPDGHGGARLEWADGPRGTVRFVADEGGRLAMEHGAEPSRRDAREPQDTP